MHLESWWSLVQQTDKKFKNKLLTRKQSKKNDELIKRENDHEIREITVVIIIFGPPAQSRRREN